MKRKFDDEIESLKDSIIRMATLVDEQVQNAFGAMIKNQPELLQGIKKKDREVDAYDNLIQTKCENILALYQPVAHDLRLVMTAIMINKQLERCGDIAVNVAQRLKKTISFAALIKESKIMDMGILSAKTVRESIDSFINNDIELARRVISEDDDVDALNKEVFNTLVEKMKQDPSNIDAAAHLIVLSRHIERLADHATNIAEEVIFLIDAQIVAHAKKFKSEEKD